MHQNHQVMLILQTNGQMDPVRAATLNVVAQHAIDVAIPVDPIEGLDGGLTVSPPSSRQPLLLPLDRKDERPCEWDPEITSSGVSAGRHGGDVDDAVHEEAELTRHLSQLWFANTPPFPLSSAPPSLPTQSLDEGPSIPFPSCAPIRSEESVVISPRVSIWCAASIFVLFTAQQVKPGARYDIAPTMAGECGSQEVFFRSTQQPHPYSRRMRAAGASAFVCAVAVARVRACVRACVRVRAYVCVYVRVTRAHRPRSDLLGLRAAGHGRVREQRRHAAAVPRRGRPLRRQRASHLRARTHTDTRTHARICIHEYTRTHARLHTQ
jgi:hypothetical protein